MPKPPPLQQVRRAWALTLAAPLLVLLALTTPALAQDDGGVFLANLRPFLEIAVFFVIFLVVFRFMRGTRGEGILKGIALLLLFGFAVLLFGAQKLELPRLEAVLERVLETTVIAFVVIFQPELRRGLMRIGENPLVRLFLPNVVSPIDEVVKAALRLSKNKVGALIAFEQDSGLGSYIEGGVKIDAAVSSELLETIFFPGSALHDGAVVLRGERIAAAGCLFPLTDNPSISKQMGTRHRAAIGLTEETDAITLVVSEETGKITVGFRGVLHRNLDAEGLEALLRKLIVTGERPPQKEAGR